MSGTLPAPTDSPSNRFSPPEGPQDDLPRPSKTELERLVDYLLASKRSLSSINHVWRANEIVTSVRGALEESVALGARMGFLGRGVHQQFQVLRRVKVGVDGVARESQAEFESVLRDLDTADARLQQSLNLLRSTMVQASLSPDNEQQKTLHDFVDEQGVDNLKARLRDSIDQVQETQQDFATSIESFEGDLHAIKTALDSDFGATPLREDSDSPIPSRLRTLENNAKEMAGLLQSLVGHFDLCVTAIKQTEGGGAAAEAITDLMPTGVDLTADDDGARSAPVGDAEKKEMLQVLEKDAGEVDDVVLEMRGQLTEMESHLDLVNGHINHLSKRHSETTAVFHMLEKLGASLPEYLTRSRDFLAQWEGQKRKLLEQREELEGLKDFYDGFLAAYDNLIIEIDRRRDVETKMNAIVREATAKLERLYEHDSAEREGFRQDQGEYLPSDIWPGLTDPPRRFEIVSLDKGGESVPVLPKKVVDLAVRRAKGRL
ncbi:MAG: autophagy protein 17 [Sclerophora amabilis]|nr:MAG: autophagy protein 17 [Sclerophora amabilis]